MPACQSPDRRCHNRGAVPGFGRVASPRLRFGGRVRGGSVLNAECTGPFAARHSAAFASVAGFPLAVFCSSLFTLPFSLDLRPLPYFCSFPACSLFFFPAFYLLTCLSLPIHLLYRYVSVFIPVFSILTSFKTHFYTHRSNI